MKQLSRIFALVFALTGAVLAYADRISELPFVPPVVAHYWPMAMFLAFVAHQGAAIVITQLQKWKDEDAAEEKTGAKNFASSGVVKTFAFCCFLYCLFVLQGCAWVQQKAPWLATSAQKLNAWNQSPDGIAALSLIGTAVGVLDPELQPIAALAVRGLETGAMPKAVDAANALQASTGTKTAANKVAVAVLAAAKQSSLTTGVPANAVLENIAKTIDTKAAQTSVAAAP